ncbi:MAG: hypothetical protein K8S54_12655 [Spirochaetia bacterium]|nr:hypothetical protein [Spirochaetia bacterium]
MKKLAVIVYLGFLFPLIAGTDEYIEWRPVPGSSGYQVQVREVASEKVLVDTTVEATTLDVDLPIGKFEHRIAPLSPFGKPIVWSDWKGLTILIAKAPTVTDPQKIVISERKPFSIILAGENFARGIKVFLKGDSTVIPITNRTVSKDGKMLTLLVNPEKIPPGEYSIILENPRQKLWTSENLVSLTYSNEVAVVDPKKDRADKKNDLKDPGNYKDQKDKKSEDYREYLKSLKMSCPGSGLPDFLIRQCYKYHLVLDLSTDEKVSMYNYIRAYQGNHTERMRGYSYFDDTCSPLGPPMQKMLEERMEESAKSLDLAERQQIQRTLAAVRSCGPANR